MFLSFIFIVLINTDTLDLIMPFMLQGFSVSQAALELTIIPLPWPLKYWDYRCEPPRLACCNIFVLLFFETGPHCVGPAGLEHSV